MTSSDDVLITRETHILSEEELAQAYQRWQAPSMTAPGEKSTSQPKPITAVELEKIHESAREEGFKAGYEEGHEAGQKAGLAAGKKTIREQAAQWQALIDHLNTPLQALDEGIEQDLLMLVQTIAQQVVQYELQCQPERILEATRSALAALPVNDRKLKVFLNPKDIELVREGLSIDAEDNRWQWLEDPLLSRGGVRLETADTSIDGSIETRIQRTIEHMLGAVPDHGTT
ncbi:Flagellar assembly protein FliH [Methylophaga frappieri]|uniref:Flagellar assembly protein FliH n=1 Tax=Methylophaga frappieri (strain ATCC BAA-2434 / DSM 25690 / JAM7) TaxID=754477 RepID=I1YKP0_METFJ|nr:flagellar assembly protein FliH [Methylophaga frappieri]AFJ03483.1 Flagellar assembly protein FliH [Methylophaga frappieri]